MSKIVNPIIPGMAPDPSILRVGEDYYIANSSFHWLPGVELFHSKDLAHWKSIGHVAKDVNLRGTNTPAGIWAPHLSYDEQTQTFWLVYCIMQNMAGREFNADSYAVCAKDPKGPWSEPIYLTSIGFDPALYHENGRHYLAILEWESRVGHQAPGTIVLTEVDLPSGKVHGWKRITHGFTTRGCVEAPQVYKHDDYYYLILASGGTGYGHGIEMGRAKDIFGPYEPNPTYEPILTSNPKHLFSLGDPDAGHFEMFNPNSSMQKAGHGSLVETQNGEFYIAHLMSRPLPGTTLNPLGRETSIQKVVWNEQGWLEMADGSNLAKTEVEGPKGIEFETNSVKEFDINEDFAGSTVPEYFMTPYHLPSNEWLDASEKGSLKIYGRGSLFTQVNPAIVASRATSFDYSLETKLEFHPKHFSQSAGIGLYYDNNNWIFARLTTSEDEQHTVLRLAKAQLGDRKEYVYDEVVIDSGVVNLRIDYKFGLATVLYSLDGSNYKTLIENLDVSYLSDEGVNGEPGEIGGFTGLFNFIGAVDTYQHDSFGTFFNYNVQSH